MINQLEYIVSRTSLSLEDTLPLVSALGLTSCNGCQIHLVSRLFAWQWWKTLSISSSLQGISSLVLIEDFGGGLKTFNCNLIFFGNRLFWTFFIIIVSAHIFMNSLIHFQHHCLCMHIWLFRAWYEIYLISLAHYQAVGLTTICSIQVFSAQL